MYNVFIGLLQKNYRHDLLIVTILRKESKKIEENLSKKANIHTSMYSYKLIVWAAVTMLGVLMYSILS